MSCLSSRDVALETQQRVSLTRQSLLYKKLTVSMWCTGHGCRFQGSPTHPCSGNFKMFQCVLFKHIRGQFCRGGLVYLWDCGLAGGTPSVLKFWASDCGVRRSDAGGWHGDISAFVLQKTSSEKKSWKLSLMASSPNSICSFSALQMELQEMLVRQTMNLKWKLEAPKVWNAHLLPERLLRKKLFSRSERQCCKLSFCQNNEGNFSHSLPSARVNSGSQGDNTPEVAQIEDITLTELS